jgi:hypothetical protein
LTERDEETEYERFIGEITNKSDIESLEGTSGGPIVGFFKQEDQTAYWVVALQSHSLGNRYVFGCPVKLFGTIIVEEVQALLKIEERTEG